MRICVLTHTFPRNRSDVAAAFMKEFCDGLVENGEEVVVVTPYDKVFRREGDKFKIVNYRYIWPDKFHVLGYSRSMIGDINLRGVSYLLLPFMIFFGILTLFKTVRKEKIELISVHWIIPNGLIALAVSKLTRVPFVVTLPGTDAYLAFKNKFFGLIAKIIASQSEGVFSNSSWHLRRILDLGVNPKYQDVITYPVDTKYFKPIKVLGDRLKNELKLEKNLIILAVGRLVYKKGFKYLIDAMKKVRINVPKARLLIGGDGDLKGELERLVLANGVADQVRFLGTIKRDEILSYYNMADVMVTPSILDQEGNIDGRPLVILESMACGIPQVVTNLPGISDNFTDGENGILVEQKKSDQLAQAIIKLLNNASLRKNIGLNNRKFAEENFSTKNIGVRYLKYFRKIVDEK